MTKNSGSRLMDAIRYMGVEADRYRDANNRYWRFVTTGNAGGTVAMLSFIGTAWGNSNGGPIPKEMVFILYVYIAGLYVSLMALLADISVEQERKDQSIHTIDSEKMMISKVSWLFAVGLSGIAMAAATMWGMVYLYKLTG